MQHNWISLSLKSRSLSNTHLTRSIDHYPHYLCIIAIFIRSHVFCVCIHMNKLSIVLYNHHRACFNWMLVCSLGLDHQHYFVPSYVVFQYCHKHTYHLSTKVNDWFYCRCSMWGEEPWPNHQQQEVILTINHSTIFLYPIHSKIESKSGINLSLTLINVSFLFFYYSISLFSLLNVTLDCFTFEKEIYLL